MNGKIYQNKVRYNSTMLRKMLRHTHTETRHDAYIPEFVYGGIDGTISSFAIVAGATGANLDLPIFLILGIGTLVASGISMGVGSFFSRRSERDLIINRANNNTSKRTKDSGKCSAMVGLTTFISYVTIGIIPLIIYIVAVFSALDHVNLFLLSGIGTTISLSIIGVVKSFVTKKSIAFGVFETLFLCGLAAAVAYCIGFSLEKILL